MKKSLMCSLDIYTTKMILVLPPVKYDITTLSTVYTNTNHYNHYYHYISAITNVNMFQVTMVSAPEVSVLLVRNKMRF